LDGVYVQPALREKELTPENDKEDENENQFESEVSSRGSDDNSPLIA
jgi:hypothetical protein